jgi:rhodanese-related sulfurtransferase/GNAT superfamily N-acetyltransferase
VSSHDAKTLAALLARATAAIERLSPAEALAAMGNGALLVDIRSDLARGRSGIVPGSIHIPRTVLEWRVAADSQWRNPSIGEDRQLIVICDDGCSSTLAAATLVELGFTSAGDVVGGFAAWREAGLPVTAGPPASGGLPGMGPPAVEVVLRVAGADDETAIDSLMKESTAALFPYFYDERQTASAVQFVALADPVLLADGTYFVLEAGVELVGCGGWSRRDRLYTGSGEGDDDGRLLDPATEPAKVRAMFVRSDWTRRGLGRRILDACEQAARAEGFRRLTLLATLAGVPLYAAYGFEATEEIEATLEDGVKLPCVAMEKPI